MQKKFNCLIIIVILMLMIANNVLAIVPLDSQQDKEIATTIQSKNYTKAIELIEKSFKELSAKEYYLYILSELYYNTGKFDKAIETADRFIKNYPNSQFYNKVILKKVWSIFSKGDLLTAYQVYKERLNYLLSSDRRFGISQIYIDLARELSVETDFFKPSTSDIQTAIEYYEKAREIGLPDDLKDDIDYEIAYSKYRISKSDFTIVTLFNNIISKYPKSEYIDSALYYSGEMYYNYRYYDASRPYYTRLYTEYPKSKFAAESIYKAAITYGLLSPSGIRNLEIAGNLVKKLLDNYSDSDFTKQGLFNLAKAYSLYEIYEPKSIELYNNFVEKYGDNDTELSPQALISIGKIYYKRLNYDKTEEFYNEFIRKYPSYKEWQNIQKELITINYVKAFNSYYTKLYDKAITQFKEFMNKYPVDSRNSEIMYTIGDIYYQQKKWEDAIKQWNATASKFPNTSPAAKSKYFVGLIFEENLGKLEDAKKAYESVKGDYSYEQLARTKITQLTQKELNLFTEKAFTTKDEQYISLGLRNINKAIVKIYNLDLKEYFLSRKTIRSIEDLDIILIKPNYEFEVNFGKEIKDTYEDYKYFANKINLPIKEAGSYVIYVESEAHKSVMLYLISDIAMTLKSTKDEALIHTKDLLNENSLPNVNVVVSSGSKIVTEFVTDKNGFFKLNLEKLRKDGISTDNLRYFAYSKKHYTSTDLYTGGIYTPARKETASYIFTDKAKYKPGDTMYYKAILRNINDGIVEPIDEKEFTVILSTSQDGQIYKTTVNLNEYGTLYGSIDLPKNLSTSSYNEATLKIYSKSYSFNKYNIPITLFKPAEREITIEFDKKAYQLGDKIKITFIGKYLSGAPTSNLEINYYLDSEGWQKIKLGEDGKAEVEIDSSTYTNQEFINVISSFSDDSSNITYSNTTFIMLKDFSIGLTMAKDTYLPDEKAQVTILTKDFLDKPISKSLKIDLYRYDELTSTTELVKEQTITTDKNGLYEFSYGDNVGGSYHLDISGVGNNSIPVSNTIPFRIIPKEGGNLIEILPEGLEFKVGETKPIKVYSKIKDGLALFTIERAKILEYQLIKLKEGTNSINITVSENYAPNSAISIMLTKQDGFYQSRREIIVKSGIDIQVKPNTNIYPPAGQVDLSINTKDVYGKPISSELMVVVVDDAVLKSTGTTYQDIKSAFYKMLALNYSAQIGSTPFAYYGIQANIDADLLAERDRRDYEENMPQFVEEDDFYNYPTSTSTGAGSSGKVADKEKSEKKSKDYDDGYFGDMGETYDELSIVQNEAVKAKEEKPSGKDIIRTLLKDTAFFKPDIKSDKDGVAKVSFTLPDNLTRWKIFVIGNNQGSMFGTGESSVISTREMIVNIDSPIELVEGDAFTFNVNLQNNSNKDISDSVKIDLIQNNKSIDSQIEKTDLKAKTSKQTLTKRFTVPKDDFKLQTLTSIDGEVRDIITRNWSTTSRVGVDGFTDKTLFRYIELDKNILSANSKKLFVRILPNTSEILKQIKEKDNTYIFGAEALTQSLIINLNLYKYLLVKEPDNTPAIEELKKEINSNINMLEMMGKNGYWTYYDDIKVSQVDYNVTAMAYFSLSSAEKAEFEINKTLNKKVSENLLSYYRSLNNDNLEQKAFIAFALSVNKKIDSAYVNSIFSSMNALSIRGLAFLSLAEYNIERTGDAKPVNELLLKRLMEENLNTNDEKILLPDYISDLYLIQALGFYAILHTENITPQVEERINQIISQMDNWYNPPHFLTFASSMYYKYLLQKDEIQSDFLLKVLVNGSEIYKGRINGKSGIIEVSSNKVVEKNKIEFNLEGNKGKLTYEAYVEYTFDNKVAENINNRDNQLTKWFGYPIYTVNIDGKPYSITKNYDILTEKQSEKIESYRNKYNNFDILQEAKQVPKGITIPITLNLYFTEENTKFNYFIVEDYVPAGFTLVEGSVYGANAVKQIGNKLIFYINSNRYSYKNITYSIKAAYMGTYRSFPAKYYRVRSRANEVIEEPDKIEVMDSGYDIFSNYKLSPYEIYPLGNLYFSLGKYDEAEKYLSELFNNWSLKNEYRKVVANELLRIAIEKKSHPNKIIEFYEILRDEFPTTQISLTDIRIISEAYEAIGEGEKAYYLVESLYRSYFGQEFDVAITLFKQDRYQNSYKKALDILFDYPDFSVARNGLYSYSQVLYEKMISLKKNDKQIIEDGTPLSKFLYNKAYDLITAYLTMYSSSFNTDEVSFMMMSLFFDRNMYDSAYQSGKLFINRFPDSQFLDDYLYLSGLALYSANRVDEAMSLLERVAYEKFKDSEGILKDSPNKLYALRFIAQSYHSKGEITKAIEVYNQIKNSFVDAQRSIEILQEQVVEIDDVITSSMNESTVMSVKHKNIDKITVKIYNVDFIILALTEKDLSDVTKVNLSGISPMVENEYILTYDKNYLPSETDITLPIEEKGAYLVVVRSLAGERSSIVIKSNLKMDVLESSNGRVRVTITDVNSNFISGVKMYFIGSKDTSFKVTETDLRGMAEVEGINGNVMIVGGINGEYVFYRSPKYISGKQYETEVINNLKLINQQRDDFQRTNKAVLDSILNYIPDSLSIDEIYNQND